MQPYNLQDESMLNDRHLTQVSAIRKALLQAAELNGIQLTTTRGVTICTAPGNCVEHPSNLQIEPMFPGSLIQHQVVISTRLVNSTVTLINDNSELKPAHIVADPESHYAQFRPLPDPLQKTINSEHLSMHILLLAPQTDMLTQIALERLEALCPVESTLIVLKPSSRCNEAAIAIEEHLRSSSKTFTAIHSIDVSNPSNYVSTLGKADMLLVDNELDCVDAVSLDTPTGLWNNHPLTQILMNWIDGGSRDELLMAQQAWLLALQKTRINGGLVVSSKTELNACVERWLNSDQCLTHTDCIENKKTSNTACTNGLDNAIIPATNLTIEPTSGKRLMNNLDISRRKFAKFRESPSRFFHDSRHTWLRPLQRH